MLLEICVNLAGTTVSGQDPGEYLMAGRKVLLSEDGFLTLKDGGTMAGSAFNTLQCANYLIKVKINP